MKVIKDETNKGIGKQTLMYDEASKKYFVVSSVNNMFANETYIFESDENGNIIEWCEVWGTRPNNHDEVVSKLEYGLLTFDDFDIEV